MAGTATTLAARTALWASLSHMRIEEPGAERRFEDALAHMTGWSPDFARRVTEEYRRFVYIAAVAGRDVTPSRAVDEAWHLHLTYTRHYWEVLCDRILGRPLHHGPSGGGDVEDERFARQYAATLALYEEHFGEPAPSDIWPGAAGVTAFPEEAEQAEKTEASGWRGWNKLWPLGIGSAIVAWIGGTSGYPLVAVAAGIAAISFLLAAVTQPIAAASRRDNGACGGGGGGSSDGNDTGGCGSSCGGGCGGD